MVNAQHVKVVPGCKTDVRDAEWIGDLLRHGLLRHGLLRASFIPDRPQRELRDLTRYRTTLIHDRANEVNRLQKGLQGANSKLPTVATDILGTSGRDILVALVAGTTESARSRSWPGSGCASRSRSWSKPWLASSAPSTASSLPSSWPH